MTKTISSRLRRLEEQFGYRDAARKRRNQSLIRVLRLDQESVLDADRCIEILEECGFLDGSGIGEGRLPGLGPVVRLDLIPDGLNAAELERFLRENGALLV